MSHDLCIKLESVGQVFDGGQGSGPIHGKPCWLLAAGLGIVMVGSSDGAFVVAGAGGGGAGFSGAGFSATDCRYRAEAFNGNSTLDS
jgi:hypothetical protein